VTEPQVPSNPWSPADLAAQLRAAADRMMAGWTAAAGSMAAAGRAAGGAPAGGTAAPPAFPTLPKMPATMTADQIQKLVDDLAARRAQVQALKTQLEAFDEQLGTLEASVRPFLEWTRTWADFEKTMTELWRPPSASGP
jgi:hypothetical protein